MTLLPKSPAAEDVFAWCEQWLACLSANDYASAWKMIFPDSYWKWTPALIEELIANYGALNPDSSGHRFRVTPPGEATGETYRQRFWIDPNDPEVDIIGDVHPRYPFAVWWHRNPLGRCLGQVHIDYPLDGEWSSLSSTFDILPLKEGLALDLERIEVM
jgi:hypothetical protein